MYSFLGYGRREYLGFVYLDYDHHDEFKRDRVGGTRSARHQVVAAEVVMMTRTTMMMRTTTPMMMEMKYRGGASTSVRVGGRKKGKKHNRKGGNFSLFRVEAQSCVRWAQCVFRTAKIFFALRAKIEGASRKIGFAQRSVPLRSTNFVHALGANLVRFLCNSSNIKRVYYYLTNFDSVIVEDQSS